ncbi:pyridoxamine 5'-phosphate oxidase family protein [bacterium]|nr:pyridoxamine 5'-phosphate oxidase family protein [bacterium]
MREDLLDFLKKIKLLALATTDDKDLPWISNVYFGVDAEMNLYFVSKKTTNHCLHIKKQAKVAFTVASYNAETDGDRCSIQGTGKTSQVTSPEEIEVGAKAIQQKFPDWIVKPEDVIDSPNHREMYRIKPSYMKFLNEKLLGKGTSEEYTF